MVATVNGTAITLDEVESLRIESSTAGREEFNQDLFQLIVEETVRQAAASQYAIVEDAAAVDAQFDQFIASIEAEGPLDEYLETNDITEETIRHVAFQRVMLPEIQQRLVEETGSRVRRGDPGRLPPGAPQPLNRMRPTYSGYHRGRGNRSA